MARWPHLHAGADPDAAGAGGAALATVIGTLSGERSGC
jgi:hypothetical protein